MPAQLAVLGYRRANRVLPLVDPQLPLIIGGHSLGGAMAAQYLDSQPEAADGLLMLAAYPPGSVDLSATSLRVLALAGTDDLVLDREKFEAARSRYPATARIYFIDGGNHAGMADYGPQRGDGDASLSHAEQQDIVASLLDDLLRSMESERIDATVH
jgi:pimeloyl-ACP methyl ester carboxylesterase